TLPDLQTMQLLDFSSAFLHPRAAALATTSGVTISTKFHSTNVLSPYFPPSSTLHLPSPPSRRCSHAESATMIIDESETDEDDYLVDCLTDEKSEELVVVGDDGVLIEVKKLEKSSRRIRSKIGMEASLDAVWSVLTDYEKLSDFIPGLVVSELVEKKATVFVFSRWASRNLALGLKFNAKAEGASDYSTQWRRREIDFKSRRWSKGDFQLFEGKWSIEQLDKGIQGEALDLQFKDFPTTLAYTVDVKPKMWLPVRLVEGRLCKEIKTNLLSIRDTAQKVIEGVIHDL
ncbi:LOW QUALITY PROTEIN: hypothetical protein HID58_013728, partial [Brassica napus]